MLHNLDPLQQFIAGVGVVGIFFVFIVNYLTKSPFFQNTDRLLTSFKQIKRK